MAQLKNVVEPFGEVNVYTTPRGTQRVVATILMEPHKEGAQTGIALDGSGSMHKLYGVEGDSGGVLSSLFGGPKRAVNEITPVAQKVCAYLARKIDADGGTSVIYWAVGRQIFEEVLAVASGKKTKSELAGVGEEEFAPWSIGPTL